MGGERGGSLVDRSIHGKAGQFWQHVLTHGEFPFNSRCSRPTPIWGLRGAGGRRTRFALSWPSDPNPAVNSKNTQEV